MSLSEVLKSLVEPPRLIAFLKSWYSKPGATPDCAYRSTNSNQPGAYKYGPLHKHDIRILHLSQIVPALRPDGRSDDAHITPDIIHATLEHIPLHQDPDFVALSYTWGTLDADHSLRIGASQLKITKNLHEALTHLYRAGITRLWIDAVCINQADLEEKAGQVLRLSTIFQGAKEVIAWVGTHDQYTSILFKCIEDQSTQGTMSGSQADVNMQLRTAFTELAKRPYWSRVWVVQEFAVAKQIRIMCGKDIIDPRLARDMIDCYVSYRGPGVPAKQAILALQQIRHWRQDDVGIPLLDLLRYTIGVRENIVNRRVCRVFKSTDMLDQVYGLLGLTSDGSRFVPEPSYEFDMINLFMYMTKSIVGSSGRIDYVFLESGRDVSAAQNCGSTARESYDPAKLPSWCPDYLNLLDSRQNSELTYSLKSDPMESAANLIALSSRYRKRRFCWNATANSRLKQGEYTLHSNGSMLAPGVFVGRILTCSEWEDRFISTLSIKRKGDSPFAWLDGLLSCYSDSDLPTPSLRDVFEALSYLLGNATDGVNCCDDERQRFRRRFVTHRSPDDLAGSITSLLMREIISAEMLSTVPSEEIHSHAHDLERSINLSYEHFGRKIAAFDTSESIEQVVRVAERHGAYSWVPSIACPGDEIWLLKGCSMPIVLRRLFHIGGADAGVFLKNGPAVVNGAMNGDMWSEDNLTRISIA